MLIGTSIIENVNLGPSGIVTTRFVGGFTLRAASFCTPLLFYCCDTLNLDKKSYLSLSANMINALELLSFLKDSQY